MDGCTSCLLHSGNIKVQPVISLSTKVRYVHLEEGTARLWPSDVVCLSHGASAGMRQLLSDLHKDAIWALNDLCCCVVDKLCLTLCDPMNCSMTSFRVLHYLPEFAQTQVHWVSDAIQLSCLLLPASPLALNLHFHQGLFQCVSSSHQVAKVLELELQHQSFQWIFRVDFL